MNGNKSTDKKSGTLEQLNRSLELINDEIRQSSQTFMAADNEPSPEYLRFCAQREATKLAILKAIEREAEFNAK